jgi:signal transduction histidine kinase/CheY-like chemotaxis protein
MKALLKTLFSRYLRHHEGNQSLLEWIGVIGAVAFPFLYLMRLNSNFPVLYDDLPWRAVATVLCVLLALRRWWPASLQPYYLSYSYVTVFYCLAFLLPFTLLHNKAITPSAVNMVLSAMLIILLTDWRNTLIMLIGGYASSMALFWLTTSNPQLPIEFIIWWVPLCGVLVACGSISKYVEKRAELERMRRLYAGIAGSIAHEMRTPLAQIQHALRCIDAEVSPGSAAARAAQQGQTAIRRGLQSISMTLQQISARNPTPTELGTLSAERCVRKALDEYAYDSPQARDRVRLDVEQDFPFRGHATALELVLFNLLKNSLYYLPIHPHMDVSITVKATPTPLIVVRDTGPGISPLLVPRLFEEFQTNGKADGTGLGLAFCRRTLREWGGDIECRSEQGHFTEFTLSFVAATAACAASPAAPHRSLAGRTVLIVDDQRFNRTIARALVCDLGLNALEAEHGQQALDMLQQGASPDVILMDVNMPGLDGMATARMVREIPGVAGHVPVFALTANDSPAVWAAAREAGMQGVLAKPIDIEALKRALATAL